MVGRVTPLRAVFGFRACGAHRLTRSTIAYCNFNIREFPEVRVHCSAGSLSDEKCSVALDDESDEASFGGGFAFGEVGELILEIFFVRDAEFLNGAGGAVR